MLFPFVANKYTVPTVTPNLLTNLHPSPFMGINNSFTLENVWPIKNLDEIHIINVASNTARWQAMTSQLRSAGITKYTRIDAVDGSKMDNKTLRGLVTTETYVRIIGQKPRTSHAEISTKGQVSCSLSHKNIWHKLVFAKPDVKQTVAKSYVTVFEDDCAVGPDTVYQVHQALKTLPSDADIILYGTIGIPTISSHATGPWVRVARFFGCQAYTITKKAAKLLLDNMGPMECQLDTFISQMAEKLDLKIYAVSPSIIRQGTFPSTIQVKGDCPTCGLLM